MMQAVKTTFKCGSTFTTSDAKVKLVMTYKMWLVLRDQGFPYIVKFDVFLSLTKKT